ncbi:MAG: hypothetical protein HQK76_04180 [Desulfobacterales bacterium]|nr:hypothetical protein [Desulfobacterales bacterium]
MRAYRIFYLPLLLALLITLFVGIGCGFKKSNSSEIESPQTQGSISYEIMKSNLKSMTDIQWNNFTEKSKGQEISLWEGWIDEIIKTVGGYQVFIDMESPSNSRSASDVLFEVPNNIGNRLKKDQKIIFSGKINCVKNLFEGPQVQIMDVEIPPEIIAEYDFKGEDFEGLTFTTIRTRTSSMTEAQYDIYTKKLTDKKVYEWTGWVCEVKKRFLFGYKIWVDMDSPNDAFNVQEKDICFEVPEEISVKLQKKQKITFSGQIESVWNKSSNIKMEITDVSIKE